MTMVGLWWMNRASGSAASSITVTATTTAITMMGTCSVMPTAVMMLSSENTRSSRRIWKIADAKLICAAPLSSMSGPWSGSTL